MSAYYSNIIAASEKLIRKYQTNNPFVIAKALGIEILYSDNLNRLKGMYQIINRNRFIILNSKNSSEINRIVCAHELGHDRLHSSYATSKSFQEFTLYDTSSQYEYEANIFAANLLLSNEEVLEYIKNGYNSLQIAMATSTDINLVALKVDLLIRNGYSLNKQLHNSKFLKS